MIGIVTDSLKGHWDQGHIGVRIEASKNPPQTVTVSMPLQTIDKNLPGGDTPLPQRPLHAAAMMVLASSLIALTTLLAKALGTGPNALPAFQITFGRFVFAFLTIGMVSLILRPRFTKPAIPIHFLRVLAGFSGVTCMFAAASLMPLADATAISYLNPMIAMLLAIPILGEKIGPVRWFAAGLAMIGGLLLVRPGTDSFHTAAFIALGAAFLFGLEVTIIKLLSGREGPIQILLMSNLIGSLLAIVAASFVWVPPTSTQWLYLIGIGVVMVTAQACFIQAMKKGDASFVVPFSYAALIFAALYDLAIYSVRPDALSVAGGTIIIASAILLAWRENQRKRIATQAH